MSCLVTLTGQLLVNPDACGGCACGGGVAPVSMSAKALALGCSGGLYQAISSTSCPVAVATPGLPGAAWVDLPGVDVTAVSLLFVKSDLPVKLRLDGREAEMASTAAFPATVAAPATLAFEVDGTPVSVALTAGSYTAQGLANAINAAAALAGLGYLPAAVNAAGKTAIASNTTGTGSTVEITTGAAEVGFVTGATAQGSGADVSVQGLFLAQFSPPISRVQVSGSARVDVLAAG